LVIFWKFSGRGEGGAAGEEGDFEDEIGTKLI